MSKYKPKWAVISVRHVRGTFYWFNGTIYTDLDESLRLAHKRMAGSQKKLRLWKKPGDVLLSSYRTSEGWGEPHTEKMPFDEVWPIFVTYARML